MAVRPELIRAVAKTKNTAKNYNDNFDMMMDFIDASIDEAKDYVDGYMPSMSSSTSGKLLTNNGTDANWVSDEKYRPIGQPIPRIDDTKFDDEVRLEGQAVSRTDYADLFAIYGTDYGSGDGSTTFNLPDFRDRTLWGSSTAGGYIEAGLPNITGTVSSDYADNFTGAFYELNSFNGNAGSGNDKVAGFDASRCSSIYGNSNTVQPPSVKVRWVTRFE